eukprot:m.80433 g.80433  ORF g.80433 m.80433 type:complete len:68 (-) comp12758_c0_seq2:1431-1634(-)
MHRVCPIYIAMSLSNVNYYGRPTKAFSGYKQAVKYIYPPLPTCAKSITLKAEFGRASGDINVDICPS